MDGNLREIEEKFKEADKKMHQMQEDLDFFEEFLSRYPEAVKNINEIEDFYFNPSYLEDLKTLEKENKDQYWSTSEDGIWNLGIDFRSIRVKLLKMLADNIYDDTLKIEK